MKNLKHVALALVLVLCVGCTANDMAKNYGGTMTINLPKGQKLINATWKADEFWYLTRPMRADEVAETFTFKEKSPYGIQEGSVVIAEVK